MTKAYYAHIRKANGSMLDAKASAEERQCISEHLLQTGMLAQAFSGKIRLNSAGKLMGLLHDLGKYSDQFQHYLLSAQGLLDQDCDDFIDAAASKGKIDHSTAGAQYVACRLKQYGKPGLLYGRLLALGMASHHSGLIDSLGIDGTDVFGKRMEKCDSKTHLSECNSRLEPPVTEAVNALFSASSFLPGEIHAWHARLTEKRTGILAAFHFGLAARFLLSCLRDADCIDSACFEEPMQKALYFDKPPVDWSTLAGKLERHLASKNSSADAASPLSALRRKIADDCLSRAKDERGLFTLTVPTGGGKTLSSLRFALHHAQERGLDRIIYIIPYTSIIDQNAQVARDILEADEEPGSVVLEHHSNILPEKESWFGKHLSQNWDAPIVFTTMVQYLEALFGSGTSTVRRMHNLANSVLIFDEIQTLPPRLTHLFCNALNFLIEECASSAVLCTATQPLLGNLPKPEYGQLALDREREIMPNPAELFAELQRVEFVNHCEQPMPLEEIGALALEEMKKSGSCLVVANTKRWARNLYDFCRRKDVEHVFYLSTALCPAHRMAVIEEITELLKAEKPVLCLSTQLIECGVDISFGAAIRFAAGLDSILQTAGRCNRNGERRNGLGRVHIVRPPDGEENLARLPEIREGKSAALRILREYADCSAPEKDLSEPERIERYFTYYFHNPEQAGKMRYNVPPEKAGRSDTLLNLLGANNLNPGQTPPALSLLRQSFKTAAECFQAIDSPARGVIVPYGEGKDIIAALNSPSGQQNVHALLRRAQRYTVNLYPYEIERMLRNGVLYSVNGLEDVLYLGKSGYDQEFGVVQDARGDYEGIHA